MENKIDIVKQYISNILINKMLYLWCIGVSFLAGITISCSTTNEDEQTEKKDPEIVYPTDTPKEAYGIDLGLTVKWANKNVGASSEIAHGNMIPWGYTKETPTCEASFYIEDTKFDYAKSEWGGEWRMPTHHEFEELALFTKKESVNGSAKLTGPNGNSIIMPICQHVYYDNVGGTYWTSYNYHSTVLLDSGDSCYFAVVSGPQMEKKSVRPVCGKPWAYEYKPYKTTPNLMVSQVSTWKFTYDSQDRYDGIKYTYGKDLRHNKKDYFYDYIIKGYPNRYGTGDWYIQDWNWTNITSSGKGIYLKVHYNPNGIGEFSDLYILDYTTKKLEKRGGSVFTFEYEGENLAHISANDDKWYSIDIEFAKEENNASVDFNRLLFGRSGMFSTRDMQSRFPFTGNDKFDALDFIGKRDKNLISKVTYTPGRFDDRFSEYDLKYNHPQIIDTYTYTKDSQGSIIKIIVKTELTGSYKRESISTWNIEYKK